MFILAMTYIYGYNLLTETDHSSASTSKDSECLEADQRVVTSMHKDVETGKVLDKTCIYKPNYN